MIITADKISKLITHLASNTPLKYVALDQGQCDDYLDELKHPPIKTPALLISPQGEEITTIIKIDRKASAEIVLRLYTNNALIYSQASPGVNYKAYSDYLALIEQVVKVAEELGWTYEGYRIGVRLESLAETRIQLSRTEWIGD